MAKKKQDISQDEFEAELKSEVPVFDSVLLGISPRKEGGFNITKATLDSKSLEIGEVTILDTAESKFEANEKFKINVIRQGVL